MSCSKKHLEPLRHEQQSSKVVRPAGLDFANVIVALDRTSCDLAEQTASAQYLSYSTVRKFQLAYPAQDRFIAAEKNLQDAQGALIAALESRHDAHELRASLQAKFTAALPVASKMETKMMELRLLGG